jgi:hypothetical protein
MVYDFPAPVWPYAKTVPLYPFRISSTVGLIEKLNMSDCREAISNTRSKVKEPVASFDYVYTVLAPAREEGPNSGSSMRGITTYV